MKQRIITALALASIAIFMIFYSEGTFKLLMFVLSMISCIEIWTLNKKRYFIGIPVLMFITIFISVSTSLVAQIAWLSIYFLIATLIHLTDERFRLIDLFLSFVIVFIISMAINGLTTVYQLGGPIAILWIFIANFMTDTGAYFVGSWFGKRKLNERLSPKKTVEGAIGGWIFSFMISLIFGLVVFDGQLSSNFIIVTSLVIPITAQVGDFFFSSIKRVYNIKDFGNLFPGHGGMLDRIDSLLFSAFAVNLLLILWGVLVWIS
ncbi:MAG TPA: phosphatidate cytidylyltransferase [Erysipelothrix sp.]|nr:phosphatidate cytidylyltransferase [Erysipelothrix sp.]